MIKRENYKYISGLIKAQANNYVKPINYVLLFN
jgi:hypothetical protein